MLIGFLVSVGINLAVGMFIVWAIKINQRTQ